MKSYPRFAAKLFRSPLIVEESVRQGLEVALLQHMGIAKAGIFDMEEMDREKREPFERYGSVAVIPIYGVLDKKLSAIEAFCFGGCDLEVVDDALAQAEADPTISRVVLDVYSPGGSVTGVPETAARIANMAKEVHAYVSCQACSGAQWIISQCDVIAAAPSAQVGSIGVYMALLDETRALEMEGYSVNLIKSGDFKAAGASFKPLTTEERALFQGECDEIHAEFMAAVNVNRSVALETMQGQSFSGKEGAKRGLVDKLTNQSLDEYVSDLITAKR